MSAANKLFQAASGGAGGESVYVEDVFSTYVYDGIDSAALTIDNGIALADEGGMIWFKRRNGTDNNCIYDTERGAGKVIFPDTTGVQLTNTGANKVEFRYAGATGFQTGTSYGGSENGAGKEIVSWTFRKQAGFFDVVTYTGDGTSSRDIAHNLGSKPGFIITKRTNLAGNWTGYHQSLGYQERIYLDLPNPKSGNSVTWVQEPTATHFTVGSENTNGDTYIAYLFAHDDQSFGEDSDEAIIKCGSWTSDGSGVGTVDLGFEPQFIICKTSDSNDNWQIWDDMRGMAQTGAAQLYPNLGQAETARTSSSLRQPIPNATGFNHYWSPQANKTWIYIAIRRPMKTPEAGTEVFAVDTEGSAGSLPGYRSGFPVDMIIRPETGGGSFPSAARLIQGSQLVTNGINAETAYSSLSTFDYMNGFSAVTGTASNRIGYMFKRATGFMDVLAYTGNATNGRTITHNLGVAPEIIITKRRSSSDTWATGVNFTASTYDYVALQSSGQANNNAYAFRYMSKPTATSYTIDQDSAINGNNDTYLVYMFATLAGVSKVGTYSGTGSDVNVDCGFSSGARFILIKRTDSSGGDWYTYDSVIQGIVAGNDPYILLNSTAAQVTNTDYIDPLNAGFTVTSSAPAALNASGGSYIFLAIA
jgi:hypothetical protein